MRLSVPGALLWTFCTFTTAVPDASNREPNPLRAFDGLKLLEEDQKFRYYDMPTELSGPCVVTAGSDGAAYTEELIANKLARIDPRTGEVTEYKIPWTSASSHHSLASLDLPINGLPPLACAIQSGADGNIYAANGLRNQIVSLNISTGEVEVFSAPNFLGNLMPLNDITPTDDSIWFTQTTGGSIGRFNIYDHSFRNYDIPTPASLPIGIFAASDGGIWFTEAAGNKIGRIEPSTGKIEEIELPLSLAVPFVIRAETEDRYVWFTAAVGNSIGRIDMFTREVTAYPIPSPASIPIEICASQNGDIWFTHLVKNTLGRITPLEDGRVEFDEIAFPGTLLPHVLPIGVPLKVSGTISCKPGNAVWFDELLGNRVGRYDLGN